MSAERGALQALLRAQAPARSTGTRALGTGLLALAAASAIAFLAGDYQLFQATLALSYAIALLGLNLLTGISGQVSLGHGAFYAIGAYSAAVGMDRFGMPYWLAPVAGAATCFVAGWAFGRPALKLEGLYLALATFALGVVMPQLLKSRHLEPWTGGAQGLVLMKPDAPFGLPLTPDQWLYVFALVVVVAMFRIARNLMSGSSGRALRALRDHPLAAEAMGIDVAHHKTMAFAVSAAYTGVGGALSAIAVQFASPDSYTVFLSISLLVGIVVGGIGTLRGALFGAVFILYVPALAEQVSKAAPWAVYGAVLILCMFTMPAGVAGLLDRLRTRLQHHNDRRRSP